jgi:hypothetical protein
LKNDVDRGVCGCVIEIAISKAFLGKKTVLFPKPMKFVLIDNHCFEITCIIGFYS